MKQIHCIVTWSAAYAALPNFQLSDQLSSINDQLSKSLHMILEWRRRGILISIMKNALHQCASLMKYVRLLVHSVS
jgi:hypothetical protein